MSRVVNLITAIFKTDLVQAYRQKMELLNPLLFFVLVSMLFPLAITTEPAKLMEIGPGVIWITVLLANLLSLENLFHADYLDGSLEQIILNKTSLFLSIFTKILVHWWLNSLPLIVLSFLIAKLYFLPNHSILILFYSLLLGSPIFTLLGSVGAALTLGLRNRGILLLLLVLPLYIPVLIFGVSAVNQANLHLSAVSQLSFLAALLSFSLTFSGLAVVCAVQISTE